MNKNRKGQPKPLDDNEWAFHKLDDDEIPQAGRWELDRHRGVGKEGPYLASDWHKSHTVFKELYASKEKAAFTAGRLQARRRIPEELKGGLSWYYGEFLLDLNCTADEIVASFRNWISANVAEKIRQNRPDKSISYWRSVLSDIAIYRADEAGYTRPQAFALMRPMFERFGLVPKDFNLSRPSPKKVRPKEEKAVGQGKLSASHWSRSLSNGRRLKRS